MRRPPPRRPPSGGLTYDRRSPTHLRPQAGRSPRARRAPHAPYFRYADPNQLVAKREASCPRTPPAASCAVASLAARPPAGVHEEIGERLSKGMALPIFSSDAICSSAYATEEILRVLVLGGAVALSCSIEVAIAIAILLAVVACATARSARRSPTAAAPTPSPAELTPLLGLVAAAALLIDYVMTVAVSTSSAVDQLVSLAPAIKVVGSSSRRGHRADDGRQPARPPGVGQHLRGPDVPVRRWRSSSSRRAWSASSPGRRAAPAPGGADAVRGRAARLLLLLKAFASGSVALTGVEAIANGVPAFKPPEARTLPTRWW